MPLQDHFLLNLTVFSSPPFNKWDWYRGGISQIWTWRIACFGRISVGGAKHFSLLRKDSFETVKKYFQRMLKIMCIAPIIAKFLQTLELHFFFRESAWNKSFPIAIVIVNWNNSRPTSSLETQLEIFIGWIFFWKHRNKFQTLYNNYSTSQYST